MITPNNKLNSDYSGLYLNGRKGALALLLIRGLYASSGVLFKYITWKYIKRKNPSMFTLQTAICRCVQYILWKNQMIISMMYLCTYVLWKNQMIYS